MLRPDSPSLAYANVVLREYARAFGADKAATTDPYTRTHMATLEQIVRSLALALEEEEVPPDQARRVLDRTILGGLPSPAEAEYRRLMEERFRTVIRRGLMIPAGGENV